MKILVLVGIVTLIPSSANFLLEKLLEEAKFCRSSEKSKGSSFSINEAEIDGDFASVTIQEVTHLKLQLVVGGRRARIFVAANLRKLNFCLHEFLPFSGDQQNHLPYEIWDFLKLCRIKAARKKFSLLRSGADKSFSDARWGFRFEIPVNRDRCWEVLNRRAAK